MSIKGFQGTSLLDYPGRIASLVFFGGCNLTCPFCHNPTLVDRPEQHPDVDPEALLHELQERHRFIDGVVISGGEPTLAPGLLPLLRQIKGMGLAVKLDTNGLLPRVLEQALAENLVDTIAIDLKTAPGRYGELHRGPVDLSALPRSIAVVLASGKECEFRTTCVPGLVEEADIHAIGATIRGAGKWMLQQFAPQYALSEELREVEPHAPEVLKSFAAVAGGYVGEVGVRGI